MITAFIIAVCFTVLAFTVFIIRVGRDRRRARKPHWSHPLRRSTDVKPSTIAETRQPPLE